MTIKPTIPKWATDLPAPGEDETFEGYWHQMGAPDDVVAAALEGLTPQIEDMANLRMADYLRKTCPDAFRRAQETM